MEGFLSIDWTYYNSRTTTLTSLYGTLMPEVGLCTTYWRYHRE